MADYVKEFDNYRIFYYAGDKHHPIISCYSGSTLVGSLRFYRDKEKMPESTVHELNETAILRLSYRLDQFRDVIDTLRYEKPLYLWYSSKSSAGYLGTSELEPVGEEESS